MLLLLVSFLVRFFWRTVLTCMLSTHFWHFDEVSVNAIGWTVKAKLTNRLRERETETIWCRNCDYWFYHISKSGWDPTRLSWKITKEKSNKVRMVLNNLFRRHSLTSCCLISSWAIERHRTIEHLNISTFKCVVSMALNVTLNHFMIAIVRRPHSDKHNTGFGYIAKAFFHSFIVNMRTAYCSICRTIANEWANQQFFFVIYTSSFFI